MNHHAGEGIYPPDVPWRRRALMLIITAVSVGAVISFVAGLPVLGALLFVWAVGIGRTVH